MCVPRPLADPTDVRGKKQTLPLRHARMLAAGIVVALSQQALKPSRYSLGRQAGKSGSPKTIFWQQCSLANDSSELACDTSARTALPMPTLKAKSRRAQRRRAGAVEREEREETTHLTRLSGAWRHARRRFSIPPPTSLSALLCLLRSIPLRRTRMRDTSLAYSTEWADRVTTYSLHDAARISPCSSHQRILLRCKLYYPSQWNGKFVT